MTTKKRIHPDRIPRMKTPETEEEYEAETRIVSIATIKVQIFLAFMRRVWSKPMQELKESRDRHLDELNAAICELERALAMKKIGPFMIGDFARWDGTRIMAKNLAGWWTQTPLVQAPRDVRMRAVELLDQMDPDALPKVRRRALDDVADRPYPGPVTNASD